VIQKGIVVLTGGMGISANTFQRGKALSCNLVVIYQISCEHLPDEIRDTPMLLCRQSFQGFVLPVFEHNLRLMHRSSSTHGRCFDQGDPLFPGKSSGTYIGSARGHYHSSPRRNGLSKACRRRLPASAMLLLSGEAEAYRWVILTRWKEAHTQHTPWEVFHELDL
jgi:hypothetical protein